MNRFQAWYRIQPRALRALLTINVVLFGLWWLVFMHVPVLQQFAWRHLALNPALPGILLEPWQLITYNFLHLGMEPFWGFIHILFNMLWLVWVGREYEEMHGPHRLLSIYLIGGLGGGVLTVLLHALFPGVQAFGGPVHGASAAVLGLLTTVAITYPYKSVALLFIGTVRLLYVVIGFLALDLLFMAQGGVSVSAHLGGALFGFLFARAESNGLDLSSWARIFFRAPRRRSSAPEPGFLKQMEVWLSTRRTKTGAGDGASGSALHPETDEAPVPDSMAGEVDRILDKISEKGYDALTEEEKRILYEASRR